MPASRNTEPSRLSLYRMNRGIQIAELASSADISRTVVYKIERGDRISRVFAARYLLALGINLASNDPLPEGIDLVEEGEFVMIKSS